MTKTGLGALVLDAANTYTGPTSIQQGVAIITGSGAISASTLVNVVGGASLDIRAGMNGCAFVSNQLLVGSGAVLGSVTIGHGSTLSPGAFDIASGLGTIDTPQMVSVPEPGTLRLVRAGLGLVSIAARRRSRVV